MRFVVVRDKRIFGLFATRDDALAWAYKHCVGWTWRVVEIEPP